MVIEKYYQIKRISLESEITTFGTPKIRNRQSILKINFHYRYEFSIILFFPWEWCLVAISWRIFSPLFRWHTLNTWSSFGIFYIYCDIIFKLKICQKRLWYKNKKWEQQFIRINKLYMFLIMHSKLKLFKLIGLVDFYNKRFFVLAM